MLQGTPAELASDSRIAPPEEPGEPLAFEGVARRLDISRAGGALLIGITSLVLPRSKLVLQLTSAALPHRPRFPTAIFDHPTAL